MGISRDSEHKRRATGGKRPQTRKKRAFLMGRPSSMTKLAPHRVHHVRTRGGNMKYRALRLDQGNFSWATEAVARKVRVIDVLQRLQQRIGPNQDFGQRLHRHHRLYPIQTMEQNLLPSKRNSMPAERKPKLPLPWLNNSPKVVSLPVLLPDQVKLADATDTSLKAKNSTSTSENSRPRNPNKCKDSNK